MYIFTQEFQEIMDALVTDLEKEQDQFDYANSVIAEFIYKLYTDDKIRNLESIIISTMLVNAVADTVFGGDE